MDVNEPRPRSRGNGLRQAQEQGNLVRKVFNCIVDDMALIQGAKNSTRDGIPKWVAAGRIRVFVPLYALQHTSRVKEHKERGANDAAEALQWLDDATSKYPDLVTLQDSFEEFETWSEVEKFAEPKTLFSENDYVTRDEPVKELVSKTNKLALRSSMEGNGQSFSSTESIASESTVPSLQSGRSASPLSPPTSPPKREANLAFNTIPDDKFAKFAHETPNSVRPIINYILWRIHQESNPVEALDSFIFLCDNPALRSCAHRFGIRTKTVADIRYVIARESQDARNRQIIQQKDTKPNSAPHVRNRSAEFTRSSSRPVSRQAAKHVEPVIGKDGSVSDNEDEILLKRAPKGPAALTRSPPQTRARPNTGRAPRNNRSAFNGIPRGNPMATTATNRGHGGSTARDHRALHQQQTSGTIDPDSFARPSPARGGARGGRVLWMPT